MKKFIFFLLAVTISTASFSQDKNKKQEQPAAPAAQPTETEVAIYHTAMKYGDFDAARYTLYSLIAKHPENTGYLDSLVRIYFMTQNWAQCILSGQDYTSRDTANTGVMEMMAISNSNLARNKEALDLYEKIYSKSGQLYHAYQVAVHRYIMQRYGECGQMIDIIVNDPASEKEMINIDLDQNQRQQVPIRASALNLRGVMLREVNMAAKAKENFEAALKIAPEFVLAKNNLEEMKKMEVKEAEKKTEPVKKGK